MINNNRSWGIQAKKCLESAPVERVHLPENGSNTMVIVNTSVMGKPIIRVGLLTWPTSCGCLGCAVEADKREVPDVD